MLLTDLLPICNGDLFKKKKKNLWLTLFAFHKKVKLIVSLLIPNISHDWILGRVLWLKIQKCENIYAPTDLFTIFVIWNNSILQQIQFVRSYYLYKGMQFEYFTCISCLKTTLYASQLQTINDLVKYQWVHIYTWLHCCNTDH